MDNGAEIADRLRAEAAWHGHRTHIHLLLLTAADEIERLERALRLKTMDNNLTGTSSRESWSDLAMRNPDN